MKMPLLVRTVAAACLLPLAAAAHGPTPHKLDESIDIAKPPADVWKKVGDFAAFAGWNPAITKATADKGNEVGSERQVTLKNGGVIVDNMDAYDAANMTYTYRLLHENIEKFPVSFYSATITVKPSAAGSTVEWTGAFYRGDTQNEPPPELSDEAAEKAMHDFYRSGLEGLKKALEH